MQKRKYENLQEERETQMGAYDENIPVGHPVAPYPQLNPYYQNQQEYPQPPFHPHPPPPFHAPPPPPIIVQQQPITTMNTYNYPTTISCPNCRSTVLTVVNLESGNTTYLWCTFLGCCVSPLLCCIPFLMESCLDKSHYCPHCGHNILRKHQKCFEFMGC